MHSDQYVIFKDGLVKKCFSIDNVCSRSSLSHVQRGHLILVCMSVLSGDINCSLFMNGQKFHSVYRD